MKLLEDIVYIITNFWPYYLEGARNTVILALFGIVGGVTCGLLITLIRLAKGKNFLAVLMRTFAKVYVEVFRGTPVIVQLWIAVFAIPISIQGNLLGMKYEFLIPCLIAICLNSGAYVSEIFRAGIEAVDRGQMEAAVCVGMKHGMAMRLIILPQAIKNVLPALCNEFITLVKETAVVSYLGVADLFYSNNVVKTMTYIMLPSFIVLAMCYFILCFATSKAVGILERRLHQDDRH